MKTTWRTWFLALGAALSLTACSDDDNYVQPIPPQPTEAGAYVLNQGSFNLVDGTLGYLNLTAGTMSTDDLFAAANEGRSMGDTPQDLVVYGSHIYLAVYGSNVVWVLDRTTRAIEQMITTEQPRDLIAADGNVYVSNYNGYVSRIDTAQLAVDARCPVGVYPEQMAVRDGYLYVVNSFGLTSDPQGSKVSKISLANFEMEEQIEVGLNPTKIIADSRGNLFVIQPGDYTGATLIKKIDSTDQVTTFAEGNLIATYGDALYVATTTYNPDYTIASNNVTSYDVLTGDTLATHVLDIPTACNPQCFTVDPSDGSFFVAGYPASDFTGNGMVYHFASDGQLKATYTAGLNPIAVVFDRD